MQLQSTQNQLQSAVSVEEVRWTCSITPWSMLRAQPLRASMRSVWVTWARYSCMTDICVVVYRTIFLQPCMRPSWPSPQSLCCYPGAMPHALPYKGHPKGALRQVDHTLATCLDQGPPTPSPACMHAPQALPALSRCRFDWLKSEMAPQFTQKLLYCLPQSPTRSCATLLRYQSCFSSGSGRCTER